MTRPLFDISQAIVNEFLSNPKARVSCTQGWGLLHYGEDLSGTGKIVIGGRECDNGFATHLDSHIHLQMAADAVHFKAIAGFGESDYMRRQDNLSTTAVFALKSGDAVIEQSPELAYGDTYEFDVSLPAGTKELELEAIGPKGNASGHVSWGNVGVMFQDGSRYSPDYFPQGTLQLVHALPDFRYGDMTAAEFFLKAPLRLEGREEAESAVTYRFAADGLGLRVTVVVTRYKDFKALEWHTTFENTGKERSPRLSHVRPMNIELLFMEKHKFEIRRRRSSDAIASEDYSDMFMTDYRMVADSCAYPLNIEYGGQGGRCTRAWLPYADLTDDDQTLRFVTGWSGQWCSEISIGNENVKVASGLQDLDAVLEPGEVITVPSAFVVQTEGGYEKAINAWRRFVTRHIMMPLEGKAPEGMASSMHWGGMDESQHLERIESFEHHGIDYDTYWIDAGWYAPRSENEFSPIWSSHVGDLDFDAELYPNELDEVAEQLHKRGKKLLLWFEPERVMKTSNLAKEHPELLVSWDASEYALLNLGDPDAWQWCWDTVSSIIARNHIDWYREDFNFDPLKYWRHLDAPDRKGISEIRFTEGLYKFWRMLRETFPHLMIDNCASGGMRLDIELLRYSVPLWYDDLMCTKGYNMELALVQRAGIATYFPRVGTGADDHDGGDTYNFRGVMDSFIGIHHAYCSLNDPNADYPHEWLRARIREYRECRDCFGGDYYEIAAPRLNNPLWAIFQYDLPEQGRGVAMAFRPATSGVSQMNFGLRSLQPDARYAVEDYDGALAPCVLSGKELMEGGMPVVKLPPRSSALIKYQRIK